MIIGVIKCLFKTTLGRFILIRLCPGGVALRSGLESGQATGEALLTQTALSTVGKTPRERSSPFF